MKREKILYGKDDLKKMVETLAQKISSDYSGKDLLIIPLLRGGFIFASDIVREMNFDVELDFMTTSSYDNAEVSTNDVKILQRPRAEVKGRHVLLIDDIADTGQTLLSVKKILEDMGAADVKTCVALNKPSRRLVEIEPDYVGFEIDDVFVVGYGLNYGKYKRNIPYIYTYEEE